MWVCVCVCVVGGVLTDLELFRLPSSDRFLAEPLFLDSHDFTPSTRSSTSESEPDSPSLRGVIERLREREREREIERERERERGKESGNVSMEGTPG